MSKHGSRFCIFEQGQTRRNRAFSILTSIFEDNCPTVILKLCGRECDRREGMPLQRDQPRAREKPRTALSASQRVIVKNHKSRASKFLQLLLILQSSSSKYMSTLMLTARQRSLSDLLFLVQREGFGAGVIGCLRTCVFLKLLLDLPRERNIWLNCPE